MGPSAALEAWVVERAAHCDLDPFGLRVWSMATSGVPVAAMAARLGLSTRQLHRRCLPTFGYGPRHLARLMRFGGAPEAIRADVVLAQVAVACGYADQAHLSREVRSLAGTTRRRLLRSPYLEGSTANRSTGRRSGSKTTA
ncbi:MAG: helix-turn-helix domain-containing protein [Acidimicrobiales bacterium]